MATFDDPDHNCEQAEQNLERESLSQEEDVKKRCRVSEQKPEQENLGRVLKKMVVMRNKKWRIKFSPGSLDG